jgi:hypothetical protein
MRAVLLAALLALAGCQVILGIDDPKPAGADDDIADDDTPIDADPGAIDGPPIDANLIDGPPASCTLLDANSCGAGMACDFNPDTVMIECRTDGGDPPLSPCSAPTDCGPVATCHDGACRTYCDDDNDCPAPQDHCHALQHPSGQTLCDSRCDWTSSADGLCGDGFHCRLVQIGTTFEMSSECIGGAGGSTPVGSTCSTNEECVNGSICLNNGTVSQCYQLCDPAGVVVCSGCTPVSNDGVNTYTVHGATVSVCAGGS